MITFPNKKNTIPHWVEGKYKSAKVLMKPAAPGTGIIAGGSVRIVMEAAGVKDILAKSLGSKNSMNVLKAVFNGFSSLMSIGQIAKKRNKNISSVWG